MTAITVRLPKVFWGDHTDRCTIHGTEVRRTKDHVYVAFTLAEIANFVSDVEFYSDRSIMNDLVDSFGFAEGNGMRSSVKATRNALIKSGAWEIGKSAEAIAQWEAEQDQIRAEQDDELEALKAEVKASVKAINTAKWAALLNSNIN